jgi:indole-3-glycerol phosphate synthase
MKKGQVKKQYTVEERLAHVEAFKASGKSLREYELSTGVKDQTLYNWVSGRNLKTQAKKAEVKKAEVKKVEVKKVEPVTPKAKASTNKKPKVASVATRDDRFEGNVKELKRIVLTHPNVITTLAVLLVGIVSTGVNVAFAVANLVTWLQG